MYVKGIYLNGTDDLSDVLNVRSKIFENTETDFSNYFDIDTSLYADNLAIHSLVIDNNEYVGCGSLYYDGEHFVLDRVGVIEEKRRQKIGDFLVRMLIDKAFQLGPNTVYVYCKEEVVPFFSSIGFDIEKRENDLVKLTINEKYVCKACHSMK